MRSSESPSWRERSRSSIRDRQRLRAGLGRLRGAGWPILQTALAAGVAWFAASLILGSQRPLFASIVAVISLSIAVGQRGRRVVELVFGVSLGLAVAGLLVNYFGVGPLQVALVVAVAMAAAAFFGGSELMVNEAAISAAILLIVFQPEGAVGQQPGALQPESVGLLPGRLLEALVGGGVALAVNALLPVNPEPMVERASHPLFAELVAVLEEAALALAEGDAQRAERAFLDARRIDERVAGFKEALSASRETARLSPPRRRALGHLEMYASVADHVDLTARNVRGLTRAALDMVRPGESAPEPLSSAVLELSRAIGAFAAYLHSSGEPDGVRQRSLRAAGEATALLVENEDLAKDLAVSVLVGQIRSAVVDLLGGTGVSRTEALAMIEQAASGRTPDLDDPSYDAGRDD